MCYPLPGPRCSPHAENRLENLQSRKGEAHTKLYEVAKERKDVRDSLRSEPDNAKLRRRYSTLTKQGAQLQAKEKDLKEKVRLAQIEYDGTPRGQKELSEEIARLKSSGAPASEIIKMDKRLSKGKAKNFTRKAQLELMREKERSGKNLKERRGDFIHFRDRSGSEEVVEEFDLLTAA